MAEYEEVMQREIETLLRQKIGLNPESIGSRAILRAVKKGMRLGKMQGLSDYFKELQTSPALFESLVESIVVPETSFFRNRASFVFLRQWIAQEWPRIGALDNSLAGVSGGVSGGVSRRAPGKSLTRQLRILSIPCSTGEEPYSLAIALLEEGLSLDDFHIDAVDISAQAIASAKAGVYSPYAFRRQTYRSDDKYFSLGLSEGADGKQSSQQSARRSGQQSAQRYYLVEAVRQKVSFSQGNILEPSLLANYPPYDIVFCRNLLIYFDRKARDRTAAFLSRVLRPNGLLFVGYAETGLVDSTLYRSVSYPQTFAFRKRSLDELKGSHDAGIGKALPSAQQILKQTLKQTLASSQQQSLPLASKKTSPLENLSDVSLLSAREFADQGQLARAVELCDRYLLQHPADAQAHLLRGELHQTADDHAAAAACFEKAIYLDPQMSEALTHLMLIKEAIGDLKGVSVIRDRLVRLATLSLS
jgi:chemotaxis protein methyltransferase WspC